MVTEPVDALAVTGEVPANDVTPVLLMVSVPEPTVVLIPVVVPKDATVYVEPLPMSNCPFVGTDMVPVPPEITGSVPVVSVVVPVAYTAPLVV